MTNTIIIAEIGINYATGSDKSNFLSNAKELIYQAKLSGAEYVKFQKRDPQVCVPLAERSKPKSTPWSGQSTYLQYKLDIEFTKAEFDEIDDYCDEIGIKWFCSVWDKPSVDFMQRYYSKLPNGKSGVMLKIPSALISDTDLVKYAADNSDFLLISTGMSTQNEIDTAIQTGEPDVVFHTNSTYPSPTEDLNLDYITYLDHCNRGGDYPKRFDIGYSGHELGIATTFAARAKGATYIERHFTLDTQLWGSDQASSLTPSIFAELCKGIKEIDSAIGGYGPRKVLSTEKEKRKTLRR
jgi:N-acetylneuraminate synthase